MSVHQVEEYYSYMQFKENLTPSQLKEVVEFIESKGCEIDSLELSYIHIDFCSESDAEEFDEEFSEEFCDLIK